jgi:RNA polymerase sigma factor (sigma-70 family)
MDEPYLGVETENESDPVALWDDAPQLRYDLTDLSDDSLLGVVRGGSADAYAVLFDRHRSAALRLAAYFSNTVDDKDIVAESFAQVYDLLRRGEGPRTSFRAYLFTCIRHEAGRRARMQKRVTPTDNIITFDRAVPFGNGAVDEFERGLVRAAFASLPERWRSVLWQLEVDGRKPGEVASILGLKPNGVSALAYRAREGMRRAYLKQHVATTGMSLASNCRDARRGFVDIVRGSGVGRAATAIDPHVETCATCTGVYLELEELNSELFEATSARPGGGRVQGD